MVLQCGISPLEIRNKIASGQERLILLQNKVQEFFVRSWNENCFSASTVVSDAIVATLNVSPENKKKLLTSCEHINIYNASL